MSSQSNPDTRPLPQGWYQHYDPSKASWYYVHTNVYPPKHSYVHPADLSHKGRSSRSIQIPSQGVSSTSAPQPVSSAKPKLSAAQMLYASASYTTGAGPSSNHLTAPEQDRISSNSPVPDAPQHNQPSFQVPYHPQQQNQHNSKVPRAASRSTLMSVSSRPDQSKRSSTFPVNFPSYPTTNPPVNKTQVPHLITKAQPPSLLFSSPSTFTQLAASIPSRPIDEAKILPALPLTPTSPIRAVFSSTNNTLTSQGIPQAASPPQISAISATRPQRATAANRASVALEDAGKVVGKTAVKWAASGVSYALLGTDVVAPLTTALGGVLNASVLQAIIQGQPNADYSAAIAVLQQQQMQQPSPAVDYQALILQIQQLQAMALQQQQQLYAMQTGNLMAAQQQQANNNSALNGPNAILGSTSLAHQTTMSPPASPNPPHSVYSISQQQGLPSLQGLTQSPTSTGSPYSPNSPNPSYQQHQSPIQSAQSQTNSSYQSSSQVSGGHPQQQHTYQTSSVPPPPPPPQLPSQQPLNYQPQQEMSLNYNQMLQNQQLLASQQAANGQQQQQLAALQQQQQQQQQTFNAALATQMQQNQAMIDSLLNPNNGAPAPLAAQQNTLSDLMTSYLTTPSAQQGQQGPSMTDLMASYLLPSQTETPAATTTAADYSQLLSSFGTSTSAAAPASQPLDFSGLTSSLDLSGITSSFGGIESGSVLSSGTFE